MDDIRIDILNTQIKLASELYMFNSAYQNDGMKQYIQNMEAIKEACMSHNYSSETGDYKGNPTLTITKEYEKDGEKKQGKVITFGLTKAEAILSQIEEIKKFVEANKKSETQTVDLDKLSSEQKELVQSFVQK